MQATSHAGSAPGRSVLVTGSSGFLGSRLTDALAGVGEVVTISRNGTPTVRGSFTSSEDLHSLDGIPIDAAVHLGAVTGGCSEEDALSVNVAGTRTLLRHLVDRGCSQLVVASSIAAVGCLDPAYLPVALPFDDEHPCEATDAYGLSKALVEELARYFHRQDATLDVTLLRLGVVVPDEAAPVDLDALDAFRFPLASMASVAASDVVRVIACLLAVPPGPGLRIVNVVAPAARTPIPTVEALRRRFGDRVATCDVSHFERPGNAFGALYTTERLHELVGFLPAIDVRTMQPFASPNLGDLDR